MLEELIGGLNEANEKTQDALKMAASLNDLFEDTERFVAELGGSSTPGAIEEVINRLKQARENVESATAEANAAAEKLEQYVQQISG